MSRPDSDPALEALETLIDALHATIELLTGAIKQAEALREQRRSGRAWIDIVAEEQRPLVVETLTRSQKSLYDAGSRFRREEARALYAQGMSTEAIARLFGVTRQRISALLRRGRQG